MTSPDPIAQELRYDERIPALETVVLSTRTVDTKSGLLAETSDSTVNWTPIRVHEGDRIHFEADASRSMNPA